MSGSENIDTAAEGQQADPVSEDPFQAAEQAALADYAAESEEGPDESDDPEREPIRFAEEPDEQEADPEEEAEPESAEDEEADEMGLTEADRSHPDIQAKLKGLDKYVNAKMQEIAAERRRQEALTDKLMAKLAGEGAPSPEKPEASGPPVKPGKDASESDWDAYYDARAEWIAEQKAEQKIAPIMDKLKAYEGALSHSQQAQQAEQFDRYIMGKEGYSQEVAEKLVELAQQDETGQLARATMTNKFVADSLFSQARMMVEAEQSRQAAAAKETEAIKRQKGAARSAVSRPTGPSKSTKIDPFSTPDFKNMSERDKLAFAERAALEDFRS